MEDMIIVFWDAVPENPGYVARVERVEGDEAQDWILDASTEDEAIDFCRRLWPAAEVKVEAAAEPRFRCPLCRRPVGGLHPNSPPWEAGGVVYHLCCLAAEDLWGGVTPEEAELEDYRGWVK